MFKYFAQNGRAPSRTDLKMLLQPEALCALGKGKDLVLKPLKDKSRDKNQSSPFLLCREDNLDTGQKAFFFQGPSYTLIMQIILEEVNLSHLH